jgi:hypothetical protein
MNIITPLKISAVDSDFNPGVKKKTEISIINITEI